MHSLLFGAQDLPSQFPYQNFERGAIPVFLPGTAEYRIGRDLLRFRSVWGSAREVPAVGFAGRIPGIGVFEGPNQDASVSVWPTCFHFRNENFREFLRV